MQFESSPSLTRCDAVMVFLRIHLWTAMFSLLIPIITGISYYGSGTGAVFPPTGLSLVPILVLWIFPSLLASNALGRTTRAPVLTLSDLRPLVTRCAGLVLFVQSLGRVVYFSVLVLYSFATSSSRLGGAFGFALPVRMWFGVAQMVGPLVAFTIGFFLAFGPTIRDNFRAR